MNTVNTVKSHLVATPVVSNVPQAEKPEFPNAEYLRYQREHLLPQHLPFADSPCPPRTNDIDQKQLLLKIVVAHGLMRHLLLERLKASLAAAQDGMQHPGYGDHQAAGEAEKENKEVSSQLGKRRKPLPDFDYYQFHDSQQRKGIEFIQRCGEEGKTFTIGDIATQLGLRKVAYAHRIINRARAQLEQQGIGTITGENRPGKRARDYSVVFYE